MRLILLFTLPVGLASAALGQRTDLGAEFIYAAVKDAVVQVKTFTADNRSVGTASGIILKSRAWLVTNYHVFDGAKLLAAYHEDLPFKLTKFLRADRDQDILIVGIDSTHDAALWARVPDLELSAFDSLRTGQRIYAIGNPFGLENTIAEGIISGLRSFHDSTRQFVQISAPISMGSSGGAVVDGSGRLVAMSTFIYGDAMAQNLNFAIPMDEVAFWRGGETRMDMTSWDENDPLMLGIDLVVREEWSAAISQLRKVSRENREDWLEAGYLVGWSYEQKSMPDSAWVVYTKVVREAPWHAKAHWGLSRIYQKRGDWEAAFRHQKMARTGEETERIRRSKRR